MNFRRTKLACYTSYFTMSSIFSLPPILFMTFRQLYGISYTLLGTLVLANFVTQMIIDLIFTFFSKYFNVKKIVQIMPLITSLGLGLYALSPAIFPDNIYLGLLIATIIFSVSAGLSEVLLSPVIAAIPSDNPQKDMSFLHSLYAFGVLSVVLISTLFLKFFGSHNWQLLTLFFAVLPIFSAIMFMLSPMPDMSMGKNGSEVKNSRGRGMAMAFFAGCIFFGSCAENVMSNWISGYMESALRIDKALGDILGMAMFAVLLGAARMMYAKYGKNIYPVLLGGMIGAALCYIAAGLASNAIVALFACILTGLFTAMLWPGSLIMMEEHITGAGVSAYAVMAASGDLGASLAPQLMGIIIDKASAGGFVENLSVTLNLTCEQIGMKAGMLAISVFPILGALLLIFGIKYIKKGTS